MHITQMMPPIHKERVETVTHEKLGSPSEPHARPSLLSNFILGSQDGLVNVLGILLGLTAATSDIRLIFVAAFAALGAESISMGAVAYTSTLARRKEYLKEVRREETEMREVPDTERSEVRYVFQKWGYQGEELERLTDLIASKPKAWLEFMMSHELQLEPVGAAEPRRSFMVVLSSTVFGSFIPLIPYFLVGKDGKLIDLDAALPHTPDEIEAAMRAK